MNYTTKIMALVFCIGLHGCSQPKKEHDNQLDHHNSVRAIDNQMNVHNEEADSKKNIDSADDQIHRVLQQLNQEFAEYEQNNPQQGYCVTIDAISGNATSEFRGRIIPHGGRRTTQQLSGMPTDEATYRNQCSFCYYRSHQSDSRFIKNFGDQSYAVTSLSDQILVIPEEHYAHLFATPLAMQVTILKNMLAIRSQHQDKIKRPMEFHCGSAAGQTVFHLHGRTGVYVQ